MIGIRSVLIRSGRRTGSTSRLASLDAAADIPEKPWLFWGCLKWKKVMDDFFHGQLRDIQTGPEKVPVRSPAGEPASFKRGSSANVPSDEGGPLST